MKTSPEFFDLAEKVYRFAQGHKKNDRRIRELVDILNHAPRGDGPPPKDAKPIPRFMIRQITAHSWSLQERMVYDLGIGKYEWGYSYPFPAAENCQSREHCEAWIRRIVTGNHDDRDGFPALVFGEEIYFDDNGKEVHAPEEELQPA